MQAMDFLKAFGLGALILALNLLVLVVIVFGYGQLIEPGQSAAFYNELALRMGRWSAPIAGAIITFVLVWLFSRGRPARNAFGFAGAVFASYFVIDTAMGLGTSSPAELFRSPFLIGMAAVALAAFFAAFCAGAKRAAPA